MSVVEPQGDFQSHRDFFFFSSNSWSHRCDLRFFLVAPLRNWSHSRALHGKKHCSSVLIKTLNRFSPLSDALTEKPDESALVIGDSIVWNVKIETPATIIQCLPGARAPDILANLKVLANAKRKFSKIVIHVGTNDVRLRQSEITKNNVKEVCELASTMLDTVICSGPLPVYRGDEIHSRLSSLNGWMAKWCPQNNIGFIDNWTSFWRKTPFWGWCRSSL